MHTESVSGLEEPHNADPRPTVEEDMLSPEHESPTDEHWPALVVGAGPAGLFAALALARAGVETLLIDAGPDTADRRPPTSIAHPAQAEYERGIGGAGLFSDGKLCLSLDVGGHLEHALEDTERSELLAEIKAVFEALGPLANIRDASEADQIRARETARRAGLTFKHYPVAHIGTDRCYEVIAALRSQLETAGATVQAEAELVDLSIEEPDGTMLATLATSTGPRRIQSERVILALGKVGAQQQAQLCQNLGIELENQPLYIGARFETSAWALQPLFAQSKDPKYSLRFEDGSKLKTHCASEQGEVITLHYSGLPLAGGHNYSWAETERSGFSLLWDGFDVAGDGYQAAREIMQRANLITGGKLMVQRLADLDSGRPSTADGINHLPLTCSDAHPGDISALLPAEFLRRMDGFLDRLRQIAPELDQDAVLYAPAIEWWMQRVVVDTQMRTSIPGLSVCGDGSGWSQGIVHAAATGLLAARGLANCPSLAACAQGQSAAMAIPA
jgi:hypothetical protein